MSVRIEIIAFLICAIESFAYNTFIKIIRNTNLRCGTGFKLFNVKEPVLFFGTLVFSARRDGRYVNKPIVALAHD